MRVKTSVQSRKRKKKYFRLAKGYYARKKSAWRHVKTQVEKSLTYSYRDRRNKKRDFRRLWIMRINAACREFGLPYHKFIYGLKLCNIDLNRKVLSDLAINDRDTFKKLVEEVSSKLAIPIATSLR